MLRNRYRIVGRLGAGAGGTVYEVEDMLHPGQRLALKALWPGARDRVLLATLRSEFSVLASLRHPRLCRVYDFGRLPPGADVPGAPEGAATRGGYFMTRELVDGVDLAAAVQEGGRDAAEVCALLAAAARGLEALHRAGMRHGDFKPANAIVEGERGVRLIDFGLSVAETTTRAAGTLAYMAPEVLERRAVDRRADLYALGIALYELLTGTRPSGPRTGAALIDWHRSGKRPSIDGHERLQRVLSRLWAPEVAQRYATAAEVAAALEACAVELGAEPPAHGAELVVAPLAQPAVPILERAYDARRNGRAGAAAIEVVGDPGSGRTTVLTELGWRAQLDGAEVVWGAAHAQNRALGAFGAALGQLAALVGEAPAAAAAAGETRLERFAAIAGWLATTSRRFPIVVMLDDLDYADEASQALARYLAFAMPADARVLVVSARRGEGATGGRAGEIARVELTPLSVDDVATLVRRAADRDDEHLAERIYRHTGGNLLHVVHTLAALSARGFPAAESLDALTLPPSLEESAAASLAALDGDERAVCEALAVLGRPAPAAMLSAMLGAELDIDDALDQAADAGFTARDRRGRWAIARPAIRATLYHHLAEGRALELHRAAVEALDGHVDVDDPELASHAVYAGDRDRVVALWRPAMSRLERAGDHAAALSLGARAIELIGDDVADVEVRRARLELGELARVVGDLATAHAALDPVIAAADDPVEVQRARLILGRVTEEAGETERAEALLREVVGDSSAPAIAARGAHQLSRLLIKRGRNADALDVAERALGGDVDASVEGHLLAAKAFALGVLGDADDTADELLDQAIERAGGAEPDDALLVTASNYAALLAFRRGDYPGARTRWGVSLAAAERSRDVTQIGRVRMNLASLDFHVGDYARCHEHLVSAVSMLRAAGAESTAAYARKNLGHCLLELGAYEQARAELSAARASCVDYLRAGIDALLALADCREGQWQRGIEGLEAALAVVEGRGDVRHTVDTLLDLAEVCLDAPASVATPADAQAYAARAGAFDVAADDHSRRARLSALSAEACARRGDADAARRHLDELAAQVDRVREAGNRHLEWSLHRSAASALEALGDPAHGERRGSALALLEEMASELPAAHRVSFWQDPRRRALRTRDRSRESMSLIGGSTLMDPASSERDGERIYRVLEIYRRMSTERDFDRLLAMAMDTAVELSGAERGFLLLAQSGGRALETAIARNLPAATMEAMARVDRDPARTDPGELPYSRTIAEQVFETGEVVVSNAPRQDPRFDAAQSVHALHIENVVCIPVHAHGRVAGVLYLESRFHRTPFSDRDLRLLMAFGDQVAILLDNARMLDDKRERTAQLERASERIEALLAERTALLARRTEELAHARADLAAIRRRFLGDRGAFGLIGRSPAMERVFQLIERLAITDVPVLVLGESGTGKELVARALHEYGPRKDRAMMSVNCGALPAQLLESELFGHVRGAFTGADKSRRGLFEGADGGTLFLDEVGDTPARMQGALLRALQEGVIRRVGGTEDVRVDVRIVAATNRDLDKLVAEGSFREDLYYRLHVVPVYLPALRERPEDIPLLAEHFLAACAERTGLPAKGIAKPALRTLMDYAWPGNVRQLEHAITNAFVMSDGDELTAADFAAVLADAAPRASAVVADPQSRKVRERQRILDALEQCAWNKSKAARLLEMPRRTFYRRLTEYDIR